MFTISCSKSSSEATGSSGMKIREKWLVMPGTRMSS